VRPSELYDIQWPIVRFYFDRAIYWWGTLVENKLNEAEAVAQMQTKRMRGNKAGFIASAKQMAFCKLMGLPTTSAFRQPDSFKKDDKAKTNGTKTVSAEGPVDLSKFNG
jgi:hypothetical protein